MSGRKYSATSGYRYGFNGKENDNEVKGEGHQQDYGMRIYDPRIARFLSLDPLTRNYPMLTPYQFASNRPIDGVDLDGNEWTTETTIENAGTPQQTVTNFMIVRVKVENQSTIVTDAAVIKAKAEVFKTYLENRFKVETTEVINNISSRVIYKTEVILDYTPFSTDDSPNIGRLLMTDRQTTVTVTTTGEVLAEPDRGSTGSTSRIGNTDATTTTSTALTAGFTIGEINQFSITMGITIDGRTTSDSKFGETSLHEAGHSADLNHPWQLNEAEKAVVPKLDQSNEQTRDRQVIKENFMNSDENSDDRFKPRNNTKILPEQIKHMFRQIDRRKMWTPAEVRSNQPLR